ncbi:MAG: hypothetical protein QOD60_2220 [Solirubrobacterales bacterium]|jgi:hypothetical protein|nr:hypothetical protein [Solirubrobacterales bacterium]
MDRARRQWGANVRPATVFAALLVVAILGYGIASQNSNGDDSRTVSVVSRLSGSYAHLELTKDSATLRAEGVPKLPAGSVYQVWVQTGADAPEASSTFRPGPGGSAAAAVPGGLHAGDLFTVTREPGPGSPFPGSRPVYAAQIPH